MTGSTCPRRMLDFGPWERTEGLDGFKKGHGLSGQPRGCTFCGSMSQEDFMQAVRDHVEIGPTDKSYKFYVHGIKREGDPDDLRVTSHSDHQFPGMKPWADLTDAERKAVEEYTTSDNPEVQFWSFRPWGPTVEGKFYTHHLQDQDLVDEFDRLWQEHQINWGYPGGPYTRIYLPVMPSRMGAAPDAG